jgi:hypothetical protein
VFKQKKESSMLKRNTGETSRIGSFIPRCSMCGRRLKAYHPQCPDCGWNSAPKGLSPKILLIILLCGLIGLYASHTMNLSVGGGSRQYVQRGR